METKNVEKKAGKITFQVVVDAERFEQAVNGAYLKNRKRIRVPGFRAGKASRKIIEGMFGKDVFYDDAVDSLALEAYREGVVNTGERTAGDPAITDYTPGEDGSITINYEAALYPQVTLGEYKGVTAYRPPVEVTEEEIDNEVEAVRKRNARIVTVERGANMGDTVRIDFDGFRNGVRFKGGKAENFSLTLGSGAFVPGFEEQLVGVQAGEEKDLDITFPENYTKELAGAAVVFKVKVHEVQETVLPELDDDFAMDVSEFDTLQEYRESLRKEIAARKEKQADDTFRDNVQRKVSENAQMEIPDAMINSRVNNNVEQAARDARIQGMTLPQYLGMMGMDERTYRAILRPNTQRQIRTELTLEAVADAEGVVISQEDIEKEYQSLSEQYDMPLERVKELIPQDVVVTDLKVRKGADIVYDAAVPTDQKEEDAAAPTDRKEDDTAETPDAGEAKE